MNAGMASICVILKDGQILLMKHHPNSFARGRWSVIGGKIDAGETPDQAVRREVAEESGLNLTQVRHAGHILVYEVETGRVTSLSLYVATGTEGEPRGSDEGEPIWWPLDQIDQLDLVGHLRLMLPLLLEPQSFLSGTIQIGPDGEALHWSLDRHALAATEQIVG